MKNDTNKYSIFVIMWILSIGTLWMVYLPIFREVFAEEVMGLFEMGFAAANVIWFFYAIVNMIFYRSQFRGYKKYAMIGMIVILAISFGVRIWLPIIVK